MSILSQTYFHNEAAAFAKLLAGRHGAAVTEAEVAQTRAQLDDIYRDHDVLISPSAVGEAPRGLDSTGDPVFGLTWTLMHGPAITLPVFTGPNGLPIGLQVTGPRGSDAQTLIAAEWIRRALDGSG